MKAIRGASTVIRDGAEEIRACVKELLLKIKEENNLSFEDILFILFSSTADLRSFYPAKAAREAGFHSCALFSAAEPEIDGSLEKCIRVMVLAETDAPARHVYLRGAAALRKDITKTMAVAIDGPAGSGKSTVSKILAEKLGILYLDTGAMYRACALKCVREHIGCGDEAAVKAIIGNMDIAVKYENGVQHTYLDGEDVSELIRKPEISMLASTVSAHGCVREKMVELQRAVAAKTSCILDGRDIGTNVLPSAPFKFYLTAAPEVRARRRAAENAQKGFDQPFGDILKEIEKRDAQDKTRKIAPLRCAPDAVVIDSSEMTVGEVVALIENKIQEKI